MNRLVLLVVVVLLLAANAAFPIMIVRTKDGRNFNIPVEAGEVATIEFTAATSSAPATPATSPAPPTAGTPAAPPAPTPPPPSPAPPVPAPSATPAVPPAPTGGSLLSQLVSGKTMDGEASNDAGKRWGFRLKITSYDKATGAIVGEINWPSLSSVHRVRGTLTASSLSFTETENIKAGSAHLNCSYKLALAGASAAGTWVDNGDGTHGAVKIQVP